MESQTKITAPAIIHKLVETFEQNLDSYRSSKNETELRREFLDKFFAALGWDVANEKGYDEAHKEVVHEFSVEVSGQQKKADYAFRTGGGFDFLVEAKKPSVRIEASQDAAFQIRRYGWSAKLPVNILTDFEHFAVYDCHTKPKYEDKASVGRIMLIHYKEYVERWDEIASLFSPEAVRRGSLAKYAEGVKRKRGTADVDDAFLHEIERWRELLAKNIALRNPEIDIAGLNYSVQMTIDRIVFLRICEERGIEPENQLLDITTHPHRPSDTSPKFDKKNSNADSKAGVEFGGGGEGVVYAELCELFKRADTKYNSGLFHFKKEKGMVSRPDDLTLTLTIDDRVLKDIISNLYYPKSPYAFLYIPADILGQVYERFLGKVIRLTAGHQAKVEEKPEVRKAGGVYYTPTYIVDYIVKNTVGKLVEGKTPKEVASLKIVDPACGSGTFLLGAYQFLLDWHLNWYSNDDVEKWVKAKAITPTVLRTPPPNSQNLGEAGRGSYRLTTSKKKEILLNHIYGVDIDAQAVEVTKLSLLLKVLENASGQLDLGMERVLPDLGNNIKCGNSLIGWDYFEGQMFPDAEELARVNPFDWKREFPDVFAKGGFDAVIGNPPYIDSEWLTKTNPKLRDYCVTHYNSAKGNWDIFCIFVEKALEIARQYSSMIIPNKLLSADYARATRNYITSKHSLVTIRDFSSVSVFPVAVYPIVYVAKAKNANFGKSISFEVMVEKDNGEVVVDKEFTVSREQLNQLEGRSWSVILGGEKGNLVQKIQKSAIRLDEIATVNGAATVSEAYEYKAYLVDEPTKEEFFIFVNTGTIDRYSILWGIQPTTYIKAKYEKPVIPKRNWGKMSENRLLQARMKKIIVGGMNKRLECVFDDGKVVAGKSTSIIYSDAINMLYLLGLLNSKLMTYYYRTTFSGLSLQGGFLRIGPPQLKELPVKVLRENNTQHDKMVSLVEQMLALHKSLAAAKSPAEKERLERQIEVTDKAIDALVYELYG
ncbi:MAG: Eco57I restriction-modification methylase domain-containing protein, partial [Anaerolineales bacterium]|nr:Eco57I restriction-modification methylase domain-containing protein [Anaerolineales bacterium]